MSRLRLPETTLVSLFAALTTWLTMSTWSGFSEDPGSYLRPLALGCLIVAVSGALLRLTRLHPVVVAVGQIVVVALWLNYHLAEATSLWGFVPTPTSIADSFTMFDQAMTAAQAYAAPVPSSVEAFPPVLVVTGTFLAILVDLLACGFRKVPLAGLPLLAMYTAPVSLLDGVDWWRFALIAVSFLCLLAGVESSRLAHWGRDLGGGDTGAVSGWERTGGQGVWPSARKIGATATGLAVVVPILIPTFNGGLFSGAGVGSGNGSGDGVRIVNPIANMKRDLERGVDREVMRVRTNDPSPEYLRVAVLDGFDGSAWKPTERQIPVEQRADGELPAPEGLEDGVTAPAYEWDIQAGENFRSQWLPAPYPTVFVQADGDWRYDEDTMDIISASERKTTSGLNYALTMLDVNPTPDQLRAAGAIPSDVFRRFTSISRAVPDWVGDLTRLVTKDGRNRAERAALLQRWFTEPHADEVTDPSFTYSLERSGTGSSMDDLTDFLQGARTGYCEQFASAMALMARTIDIPSRVAVGFLKPERAQDGSWIFSSHDLHAWPELYFEGVGWTRFEPTPSSRQGATPPSYTAGLQPSEAPTGGPSATAPTATPGPTSDASPRSEAPTDPVNAGASDGSGPPWALVVLVVLLVLAALACVPRAVRTVVRRRRWSGAETAPALAEAAWSELRASLIDLRLPWDDQLTVRQRAAGIAPLFCRRPGADEDERARVIRSNPDAQAALDRLVLFVERSRYARTTPPMADLRADVELCVEAVRIGLDVNARRRADWLPLSVLPSRTGLPRHTSEVATLEEPALNR